MGLADFFEEEVEEVVATAEVVDSSLSCKSIPSIDVEVEEVDDRPVLARFIRNARQSPREFGSMESSSSSDEAVMKRHVGDCNNTVAAADDDSCCEVVKAIRGWRKPWVTAWSDTRRWSKAIGERVIVVVIVLDPLLIYGRWVSKWLQAWQSLLFIFDLYEILQNTDDE